MYSYKKILALYSPGCTIHPRAYLKPNSLYLPLLPRPYIALPPPHCLVTAFVVHICKSGSFLLYSHISHS